MLSARCLADFLAVRPAALTLSLRFRRFHPPDEIVDTARERTHVETAHFARDTLHGACAKPKLAGDFKNALASTQLALDTLFHVGADFRRYWLEPL
jgi:hypothetical protein